MCVQTKYIYKYIYIYIYIYLVCRSLSSTWPPTWILSAEGKSIYIYNRIVTLQLNSATLSKQTPFFMAVPRQARWSVSLNEACQAATAERLRTALPASLAVIGGHKLKPFRLLLLQCLCAPERLHWGENAVNFLSFRKIIVAILKERKWNPEIVLS